MTTTIDYRPRHSWEAVRFSTTQMQLLARMTVLDAVGEPAADYDGRHRSYLPLHKAADCAICRVLMSGGAS